MIRDRLKNVAKKVALRAFNMQWDAEETRDGGTRRTNETKFDEALIPKIVDGSGDTPGPNHKEDIGRTWTAATLVGGVSLFFIDMRPPAEVSSGMLPGAVLMPGDSVKQHLNRLPAKDVRVTVYDQTGELGSTELAAWLREQGWTMARRLRGGYAEWIEHGEAVVRPELAPGAKYKVSDPVRTKDGQNGWVQEVTGSGAGARYTIWLAEGRSLGPLGADALAS